MEAAIGHGWAVCYFSTGWMVCADLIGVSLTAAKEVGNTGGKILFQQKLQKILLRFRKHHRAEFGCYEKKFKSRILADNSDEEAVALADFLFSKNLLTTSTPLIVMNQDKLSSYDINYAKQNEITFGAKSNDLYEELISSPFGSLYKQLK